jgi:hypothetical protein
MDEAIKLDQQQYPDCFYSTMSESMCSLERHEGNKAGSSSGAYICSVLKKVQRNCAGKRPVTIYSHREEKNDPSQADAFSNDMTQFSKGFSMGPFATGGGFGGFGGGGQNRNASNMNRSDMAVDAFALMDEMFREFSRSVGSGGFSIPGSQQGQVHEHGHERFTMPHHPSNKPGGLMRRPPHSMHDSNKSNDNSDNSELPGRPVGPIDTI